MANFSTGDRVRKPKGDRLVSISLLDHVCQYLLFLLFLDLYSGATHSLHVFLISTSFTSITFNVSFAPLVNIKVLLSTASLICIGFEISCTLD